MNVTDYFLVGDDIAPSLNPDDYLEKLRDVDQDILSGIMAVVGLLLTFFGERLFDIVVFGVGFVLLSQASYYALKKTQDKTHLDDNPILYISLGAGVLGGGILVWLKKVSIFVIGAIGGVLLLNFLYGLTSWSTSYHEEWVQYAIIGVGAILGGLLVYKVTKQLLRGATAFVGAFAVASSLGYLIVRVSDERVTDGSKPASAWLDIAEYFWNPSDVIGQCSDACIGVLAVWFALTLAGCWYQYRTLACCKRCRDKKQYSSQPRSSQVPLLVQHHHHHHPTGQQQVSYGRV